MVTVWLKYSKVNSSSSDSVSKKVSVENQVLDPPKMESKIPEDNKVLSDPSVIADTSEKPTDPAESEQEPETQTAITE